MTICVIWVLIRGPGVLDIGESEPMGLNIPERKIFSISISPKSTTLAPQICLLGVRVSHSLSEAWQDDQEGKRFIAKEVVISAATRGPRMAPERTGVMVFPTPSTSIVDMRCLA